MKRQEFSEHPVFSSRWKDLLSDEDKERLQMAYRKLFPGELGDGYEVVYEVGTASGRLLTRGRYAAEIRFRTAQDEIQRLKQEERAYNEYNLWTTPGWQAGMDRPVPSTETVYTWTEQALVPPLYWESRTGLTIGQIKLDRLGITIFAKKAPQPAQE